ncbi:MAG: AsmA family protein [Steroidobacteraceae bacterium]
MDFFPVVRPSPKWLYGMLLALAVLALSAAAIAIGANHLRGPLLRAIAARSGHPIRVDGEFAVQLLARHPTVTATQVSIGNPAWMPPGHMAQIGRISLTLAWQWAAMPLAIHRVQIEQATLHLVREASGHANWTQQETGAGSGPPLIRSLSMRDAHVELHDELRQLQFSGTASVAETAAGAGPPSLRIEGRGPLNGRPVVLLIVGDPLLSVRRGRPYHFTLEERSGSAHLSGQGFIEHPFDFRRLQGTFAATGPDLKDLYFLIGLGLPETGPFRLSGKLERQGKRFIYSDLAAHFGQSDLGGTLTEDGSGGRSSVEGELSSTQLTLADIGARAAGHAPEPSQPAALRIPDTALRLSGLRRTDWRLKLRAQALTLGPATLRSVTALLAVDHGVLSVERFGAALADGTVSGSARLDAARDIPRGTLNLSVADLPLEQLHGKSSEQAPLTGLLSGRLELSGEGNSPHELAATANGTVTAVIPRGTMRSSIAELIGLSLTGAFGAKTHPETGIRCAVASFDAHDGVVSARTFVLDTDQMLISGTGEAHLDSETLDFVLRGRPHHVSLGLHSPVALRGTLAHPEIRLAGRDVVAQAGAAVALGILLTPVAAALAFVNPGLAHNPDCAALLAQATASTGASQPQPALAPPDK